MARFKASDLLVRTNDEILFGDSQEVSMKYDGSDLLVNSPILASDPVSAGHLATKTWTETYVADNAPDVSGLIWQDAVLSYTQNVPETGNQGDRYIAIVPSGIAFDPDNTHASVILSNENLTAAADNPASWRSTVTNIELFSGKWYWEITIDVWPVTGVMIGIGHVDDTLTGFPGGGGSAGYGYYDNTGQVFFAGAGSAYGDAYGLNDVIGVAMDLDNGKVFFSLNDVWQDSGDPVAGTNPAGTITPAEGWSPTLGLTTHLCEATLNVGTTAWAGTLPSGYTGVGDTGVTWFDNDVLEWDTSSYTALTPSAGFATWVTDEGVYYIFDGADWGRFGGVVSHSYLLDLTVDDHDSLYPLITNFEADRGTIATNWTDLTDSGDTTLHDHDGITENSAARHTQGTDTTLGTMTGDIDLDSYKLTTTGNVSAGGFYLDDAGRLHLGTDNDSVMYHNGSHAYWDNATGDTFIRFPGSEIAVKCTQNGSVTLYHNGNSRLVTTAGGITVTGDVSPSDDIYLGDTGTLFMGDNPDASIYNNGTHSYWDTVTGNVYIRCNSASENLFVGVPNAGVTLSWDGNTRFATTTDGIDVTGNVLATGSATVSGNIRTGSDIRVSDGNFIYLGTQNQASLTHIGGHLYLDNTAGNTYLRIGGEEGIVIAPNAQVQLYYDNNAKLATTATGIDVTGQMEADSGLFTGTLTVSGDVRVGNAIYIEDSNFNGKIILGSLNESVIQYNTGNGLFLESMDHISLRTNSNENAIVCTANAQVQLYYDGNEKLATTATGIDVTGDISGDTFTVATSAGATGWFDDGANFRVTVEAGIIIDIGASVAGGIG